MSIIHLLSALAHRPTIVNLDGATALAGVDTSAPYDSIAGIRFNTDGTIDLITGLNGSVVYTQTDAATDWIIPNSAASVDYDVRFVSYSGGTPFSTGATTTGNWIDLGATRDWFRNETDVRTDTSTCTFEVRDPGGTTVDTGVYLFTIDNGT